MKAFCCLVFVLVVSACSTPGAVSVDCERHLVPINVPERAVVSPTVQVRAAATEATHER